jgi:hypothetical protein
MVATQSSEALKRYSGLLVFFGVLVVAAAGTLVMLGPEQAYQQVLLPQITMPAWLFGLVFVVPAIAMLYRYGRQRQPEVVVAEEAPPEQPESFEDRRFIGKEVALDGKAFRRCEFNQADLVLRGDGVFDMSDCQIVECRIIYDSPAAGVLDMFSSLYQDPAFQPIVEETFNQVRQGQSFS